jgi:hypothetical protein
VEPALFMSSGNEQSVLFRRKDRIGGGSCKMRSE